MSQELWAIKGPDGEIDHHFINTTAEWAWLSWNPATSIEDAEAKGYRAVRVRVEEIEGNESDDSKGGE